MEEFARFIAQFYNIESRIDRLDLDVNEANLEAKARHQRYRLFSSQLTPRDALLTAHHMNDQAETLMLNLMRGSGVRGLAAMPQQRKLGQGLLFRPLLDHSRSEIESYARDHNLKWVEDSSNQSLRFDRNYIRHHVLPTLTNRWPGAIQQLARVSQWQNESDTLINDLAKIDFQEAGQERPFSIQPCLSVNTLCSLSDARKKNLIRYWIKNQGKTAMGYKKLAELLSQLNAAGDSQPVIEGVDYSIRRYQGYLFLVDFHSTNEMNPSYELGPGKTLQIPLAEIEVSRESVLKRVAKTDQGQKVCLNFRKKNSSGQNSAHSHKLKRLFQEHRVPPWLRADVAQIFIDEELLGLWLF